MSPGVAGSPTCSAPSPKDRRPPPGSALQNAVATYRDRWDIDDSDSLLGPPPDSPAQRGDRDETLAVLRDTRETLDQTIGRDTPSVLAREQHR